MHCLVCPLKTLVLGVKDALQSVVNAANRHGATLKFVLAIDEGSTCTQVIRGILRFPEIAKTVLREAMFVVLDSLPEEFDVLASDAGTGVASSTIGSPSENFAVLKPYHEREGKEKVFENELGSLSKKLNVPWSAYLKRTSNFEVFKTQLPVAATLMQNGRMASIAFSEIRKYKDDEPVCESRLVDKIVYRYMESNGLKSLIRKEMTEKRQAVAAAALAVHLFRGIERFKVLVPPSKSEIDQFAQRMDFFPLASNIPTCLLEIVSTFGLLEPTDDTLSDKLTGKKILPPLHMQTAQQLVAAHMLGIGLKEMLDPSWIGFEILSTHVVKCALAACVAVPIELRPTVAEALGTLGFQIDQNATRGDVKEIWKQMKETRPVGASPQQDAKSSFHRETSPLRVELKIIDTDRLQIDKVLYQSLTKWHPAVEFAAPIACTNYGNNSDLPDGFVTFYARTGESPFEQKWSVLIQAKGYHGENIKEEQLNKLVDKAMDPSLNGVFGKNRLLCVASSASSFLNTGTETVQPRNFLPFAIQKGKLLKDLLIALKFQRSRQWRTATFSLLCSSDGTLVEDGTVGNKRKLQEMENEESK